MHALLCTLGAFGLILLLTRLRCPLAAAIIVGAATIGTLFGMAPAELAATGLAGALRPTAIALVGITMLLLTLSGAMRVSGQLEGLVNAAMIFFRRPVVTMAALPAMIGLIPMPGGALFSAPMVASAAGDEKVAGGTFSAINYWFRHIWEYWWPLYPGVILAVTLTPSGLGPFMLSQMPLTIFMVAAGLLILRRVHPNLHRTSPRAPRGAIWNLLRQTSSIWIIIAVWAVAKLGVWAALGSVPVRPQGGPELAQHRQILAAVHKFAPVALGLLASLIWTARTSHLGRRAFGEILADKSIYAILVLVLSVMVFQHVLGEAHASARIARELNQLHVPVVLVVAALPFIAGMVTGLAIGFVGTSFPIVLGLVQAMPATPAVRAYMMLAYAFGHMGQMMSPLHLCQVVSNRYFGTTFAPVYRRTLPSAVVTAVLAVAYFLALRALMS